MKSTDPQDVADSLTRFRRHLALGVGLLLLLVAGGTALALWDSHRAQGAEARQSAANVARTLAPNVAARLRLADNALQSALAQFDRLPRGAAAPAQATVIARDGQALLPAASSLRLADADGRALDTADVALSPAGQQALAAVRRAPRQLAVSEPVRRPSGEGWNLTLARARLDAEGRFAGAVFVELPAESLAVDFRHADLGQEGAAALRTRTLTLVARHAPGDGGNSPGIGSAQASAELRAAVAARPERGNVVSRNALDGIERVTAYEAVPGYPLLVLAGLSTNEVFAPWRRQAVVFGLLALGQCALILTAAWFAYGAQTRQVRAREQLAQLASERGALLDNELVPMVRLRDRQEVWHNRALAQMFGYEPGELSGQSARVFYPDDATFERAGRSYRHMPASGRFRAQLQMVCKDGRRLWIDLSGTHLPGGDSLWMMVDITAVKEREEQARHLALHDALTGLPNRHLLQERLGFLLRDAGRQNAPLAVCYLDLDGFKAVNDSRGHDAGDALLRAVGQRLNGQRRGNDVVARIGGDEFVVVLCHLTSPQGEVRAVERLLQCFDTPFALPNGSTASVGASIGVALFPQHGQEATRLVTLADQAMLAGKRAGKGRWVLHTPVAPAA